MLLAALAALALSATGFGLLVLASRMFGIPLSQLDVDTIMTILELPGLGFALGLRVVALIILLVALARGPLSFRTMLAAQAVALATLAWAGHAAAADGWTGWLHLGSTIMHLWAAGLWMGAIVAFLLLAKLAARGRDGAKLQLSDALGRFYRTGTLIVALLVASGVLNILLITGLPPERAALTSQWGLLMAAKLTAFAGMLGLAALNRFRLAPALNRSDGETASVRRSLGFELALAFLILGLVAMIGLLSPTGE